MLCVQRPVCSAQRRPSDDTPPAPSPRRVVVFIVLQVLWTVSATVRSVNRMREKLAAVESWMVVSPPLDLQATPRLFARASTCPTFWNEQLTIQTHSLLGFRIR